MEKDNITEEVLIRLFTNKWGSNLTGRIKALHEEFEEFKEAYHIYSLSAAGRFGKDWLHVQDEAADLYSVALHILACADLNHQEAMNMVWDKIKTREVDPNYKKDWDDEK